MYHSIVIFVAKHFHEIEICRRQVLLEQNLEQLIQDDIVFKEHIMKNSHEGFLRIIIYQASNPFSFRF